MHLVGEAPYFTSWEARSVDEFYEANHFLRVSRDPYICLISENLKMWNIYEYTYIIAPVQPIPVPYTNSGEEMEPVTNSEDTNFWKNTFKHATAPSGTQAMHHNTALVVCNSSSQPHKLCWSVPDHLLGKPWKIIQMSDITLDVCTEKGIQMQKVEGL